MTGHAMTSRKPLMLNTVDNLSIPGRHEGRALIDCCPDVSCLASTEPVAVLDLPDRRGRVAAYRCGVCGQGWLCSWATP